MVIDGRYRVRATIGRGGMATVLDASHLGLGRPVALKVMKTDSGAHPEGVERFLREAKLASSIGNRHIIDVRDVGRLGNGAPFMAMELLDGEDLASYSAREGPLELTSALAVIDQVCGALSAAHALGIVHCDVKPANIFLTEAADKEIFATVLDFGISSLAKDVPGQVPVAFDYRFDGRTGRLVGTPLYMSPQLFRGDERTISDDVYALGVVLYELLAGQPPYRAESWVDLMTRILTQEPRPLSEIRPDIPEAVATLVARALQKDPVLRPQSCAEFMVPLRPFLSGKGYRPADQKLVDELEQCTRTRHKQTGPLGSDRDLERRIETLVAALKSAPQARAGDMVLGCKLLRIVGKGNFGTVWEGEHLGSGERRALKIFDSDRLGLGLSLYHFRRGVRVMRHLSAIESRPSTVVTMYEAEHSGLALSMTFLPGGDLEHVASRSWTRAQKIEVFIKICRAVHFAHVHGILHRDIKPANVVLDANGEPVLTDFDIADFRHIKTMSAQAKGTVVYAAPEQLAGKARRVPSGDVFSLGRLFEFLLTERDPEFAPHAIPVLAELEQAHGVGAVRIIRKCTCRDPDARYLTVSALLQDVEAMDRRPEAVGIGVDELERTRANVGRASAAEPDSERLWARASLLASEGALEEAMTIAELSMASFDPIENSAYPTRARQMRQWRSDFADQRFAIAKGFASQRNWEAALIAATRAVQIIGYVDDAASATFQRHILLWQARTGDVKALGQITWRKLTAHFPLAVAALVLVAAGVNWKGLVEVFSDRAKPVATATSPSAANGELRGCAEGRLKAISGLPEDERLCLEGLQGKRRSVVVGATPAELRFEVSNNTLQIQCGCGLQPVLPP